MMSRCSKKKTTARHRILDFLRGAAPWDDEHGTALRFGQTEHPPALSIGTSPEHRCSETHRLEKFRPRNTELQCAIALGSPERREVSGDAQSPARRPQRVAWCGRACFRQRHALPPENQHFRSYLVTGFSASGGRGHVGETRTSWLLAHLALGRAAQTDSPAERPFGRYHSSFIGIWPKRPKVGRRLAARVRRSSNEKGDAPVRVGAPPYPCKPNLCGVKPGLQGQRPTRRLIPLESVQAQHPERTGNYS